MALTLADPGLVATDEGHAYVLSREPDNVERARLGQALRALPALPDEPAVEFLGDARIAVKGLTEQNREPLEAALRDGLIAAHRTRLEAEATARGGAAWSEEQEAAHAEAAAAVKASFEQLPSGLP